jgi:hypothetical protein
MSPRILHYTKGGVFWECREEYRSEEGYHFILSKAATDQFTVSGMAKLFSREERPDSRSSGNIYPFVIWYTRIVPNYTKRKLTFGSDKLVTISAIARAIHWQTGSSYLVGIWSRQLAWGLLWQRLHPWRYSGHSEKPAERNPSWTWEWIIPKTVSMCSVRHVSELAIGVFHLPLAQANFRQFDAYLSLLLSQ